MGIQNTCCIGLENRVHIKSVSGIFKRSRLYVLTSICFIASLFVFEYAFAKSTVNQDHSQSHTAPLTENTPSTDTSHTPTAQRGLMSDADIAALVSQVGLLNEEKSKLDNAWRIERNKYGTMKIRIDDSKKTIRLEMDEVLLNNSPRERLDDLLSQHQALSKDEKELAQEVLQLEEKLAAHQLLLAQAHRDLQRARTLYAAQQREQDIQRVAEITQLLDRELRFNEQISFKCSTNKSLAGCLNDYPLDLRIQGWVKERYQTVLTDELAGKIEQIILSSDWYSTEVNRNFTEASMSLDGSITAQIEVRANVVSHKMMACALLKAPVDLCEAQSVSLIVRSNKYGDQVYINNKLYGSTPLSVMLDPGTYNVEVKYQGLTQKRTLTLDENRNLNFVF